VSHFDQSSPGFLINLDAGCWLIADIESGISTQPRFIGFQRISAEATAARAMALPDDACEVAHRMLVGVTLAVLALTSSGF
jgi:hypothetical protein